MTPRKRVLFLTLIMTLLVVVVQVITISTLYKAALNEETLRLTEAAKSQARLIEAVARFDKEYSNDYPYGTRQATLSQVRDAHSKYQGFGETGEFTLSRKEGNQIIFLLSHRHHDLNEAAPVPWDSKLAEPMRRALSGHSGVLVGLDYRGETVLAAYEPVAELDLGIVAKIDLAEIRAPFFMAGLKSGMVAILFVLLGVVLFFKITNPLLTRLQNTVASLEKALVEVKTLRGILPICSFCKKIRDDGGHWNQIESYVRKRSDADFSHSVCPDCLKDHYGDEFDGIENQ